jgi:hypothetical protein
MRKSESGLKEHKKTARIIINRGLKKNPVSRYPAFPLSPHIFFGKINVKIIG